LEPYRKKYRSQEVASNKLEKGLIRDYEKAFCLLLALMVLEVFHFLFGNSLEFKNHINKFKRGPPKEHYCKKLALQVL
jgi:hypothetical protein